MKSLIVVMVLCVSSAFAGVKAKKQIKANKKMLVDVVTKNKKTCGYNPELKINWKDWSGHDYKKIQTTEEKTLLNVGHLIKATLNDITKLCKDVDYKEAISKIKKITITAKKDLKSRYIDFKLNGTALELKLNLDGVGSWKNADLLKEVWE